MGNNLSFDAIVVGGGIVGAACAYELKLKGLRVLLIDAGTPGTGVTAACMGHVVVMDDSPEMLSLTSYSRKLWDEISKDLPANCEDLKCGTMWIAEDEEELQEAVKKMNLYKSMGVDCEIVSSSELETHEPNLKSGLSGALRIPGDRVVYPTNCVDFFLRGVECKVGERVTSVAENAVTTDSGIRYEAEKIIVAAGALSKDILDLPLLPKKGHLLITERYPGFANHQIIELGYIKKAHSEKSDSCAFNIQPRSTGQMIIGSSREYCGFDKSINKKLLSQMLARANYFMPDLKKLKALRVWTGFRPASEDGLPIIGFHSEKKVYVCTGHEGLGITSSLASAKIIVAQITGETPSVDSIPFSPERLHLGGLVNGN